MQSLKIKNLTLKQDDKTLLSIDETVAGGDVLTIMGPSGSGKSTFLNWLVGMLPDNFQATGELHLNEQNITDKSFKTYWFVISRSTFIPALICCRKYCIRNA